MERGGVVGGVVREDASRKAEGYGLADWGRK